jgi:hypothetical protein
MRIIDVDHRRSTPNTMQNRRSGFGCFGIRTSKSERMDWASCFSSCTQRKQIAFDSIASVYQLSYERIASADTRKEQSPLCGVVTRSTWLQAEPMHVYICNQSIVQVNCADPSACARVASRAPATPGERFTFQSRVVGLSACHYVSIESALCSRKSTMEPGLPLGHRRPALP